MHYDWFFISLAAPTLWTIVNYIDKYILSKHLKEKGVGAIFLFSSFFSIIVVVCAFIFTPFHVLSLPLVSIYTLICVGILSAMAFYLYLRALDIEESSVVVPLLQLTPVFGYILGYFLLGEVLSKHQIFAALIIIFGIIILSLEFEDNNVKLKRKVLLLLVGSSFMFALYDVLFKKVTINGHFSVSIFWQYLGILIAGICIFIYSPLYRKQFLGLFRRSNYFIVSLNVGAEVLYIIGNLANNFATLLAPVALVLIVTSYQPLFVFLSGTFLTVFLPSIIMEKISSRHLIQKILSISIILIGSYLLYSS